MENVLQQTWNTTYTHREKRTSLITRFIEWCNNQEENRFAWLAAAITAHGCFLTPITVLAITMSGNSMFLWAIAIAAMGATLVTNLAAMPAKITIPTFLLSIVMDLTIIIYCIANGLAI
jgi:hypothetical protein